VFCSCGSRLCEHGVCPDCDFCGECEENVPVFEKDIDDGGRDSEED
jgi:hypothetical protein